MADLNEYPFARTDAAGGKKKNREGPVKSRGENSKKISLTQQEEIMRIYIIHPSDTEENYIDRILSAQEKLIEEGHHVLNPLPDDDSPISNKDLHLMYMHLMRDCDAAYVMDGWKSDVGNAELAEMMIHKKTIMFEK